MPIKCVKFITELKNLISKFPKAVTEDLVRLLFIKAHPNSEIEVPYMRSKLPTTPIRIQSSKMRYFASKRIRADLVCKKEDMVVEFKCHRKTDYSPCCTATDMGAVFCDLNRLSCLDNKEKYFIYVFDSSMQNYYNKIMKKHTPSCPLQMFDISSTAVGKSFIVDKTLDSVTHGYNEFRKTAFSSFVSACNAFSCFNYSIDILQAQNIGNTGYYIIIAQIK